MTRDEIFDRVRSMLVETFEIDADDVALDARLVDDLDLDSIDAIDMVVHLQGITGRRVEEEVLRQIRTVRDVVDMVEAQLAVANA